MIKPLIDRYGPKVIVTTHRYGSRADLRYHDYGFGQPTTSSPGGGTGHYTELTCTFPDGAQTTFPNEEVGLKGIATSFLAAGVCSSLALLWLVVLAAGVGWRIGKIKLSTRRSTRSKVDSSRYERPPS